MCLITIKNTGHTLKTPEEQQKNIDFPNSGKLRETQGNSGKLRETQGTVYVAKRLNFVPNSGKLRETQGNSGKFRETQGNSGKLGETHGNSRKLEETQGVQINSSELIQAAHPSDRRAANG